MLVCVCRLSDVGSIEVSPNSREITIIEICQKRKIVLQFMNFRLMPDLTSKFITCF